MNKAKEILIPAVVLFLISVIVTAALAGTNALTKDTIAELEAKAQAEAMARVVEADSFEEAQGEKDGEAFTYNTALLEGETVGYVFVTAASGYGGDVSVMTAVDPSGTILAIEVLSVADETPGLGANAGKSEWWAQFSGLAGELAVNKDGGEIDALTGATITSRAVTNAVNTALAQFESLEVA